jgi:hypothetical protein
VSQYYIDKQSGPEPGISSKQAAEPVAQVDPSSERALMLRIYEKWHSEIVAATRNSALSAPFLAALTANESGGDPLAHAFEAGVYGQLQAVIRGQQPGFGSIVAADLIQLAEQDFEAQQGASAPQTSQGTSQFSGVSPAVQEKVLRQMATSWGLTQIMGYQTIKRKKTVQDLLNPASHYAFAVELLEELGRRFHLNLSEDAEPLFRSWNSGRPNGKTFDCDYVSRGMERLRLYSAIARAGSKGEQTDGV